MFHRQTLFVIGAGASFEAGLPTGKTLANIIGSKMDIRFERGFDPIGSGDFELYGQINQGKKREYQPAAWIIRDGIPFAQSIDHFLDQHRTNQAVNHYGKAAIVKAILEAERSSNLFFNPHQGENGLNVTKLSETWFMKFMHMLARGVQKEDVHNILNSVSFIVFNYDRCIQHFLINAIERAYNLQRGEAQAIVAGLRIFHPYGNVGPLDTLPFGSLRADCFSLAQNIKTYTEQVNARAVIEEVQKLLHPADCIVFLGFAYHSQNMRMLRVDQREDKVIYGTAVGVSDSDLQEINLSVHKTFAGPGQIHLDNKLRCADLFDYYAKSLTGGD